MSRLDPQRPTPQAAPRKAPRSALALPVAALLVALMAGGAAPACAEPVWFGDSRGETAHLTLGVPGGEEWVLDIACARGSGTLALRTRFGSNGLLPGEPAEVTLENSRARVVFPGTAVADAPRGAVDVEARGPLAGLATIVRTNRPFVAAVKGARYIMSQAGMAEPYAALVAACGG
ncbi:hypothetical protein [Ancylobacter lacus]|uniref:hypothetical protein n=1 Tax=Ancylobacter lacus TaxID=2579970 RepID=UPI001BCDE353|nr:hypothetical protein [Ancylobacter lacus]MBS7539273.1 hypothetical protein [Ancylobacter lacus]